MADQLCTPSDLVCSMQIDAADTYTAVLCIEAATAVVQSLTGERIVDAYPPGSQELQLARAVVVALAKDAFEDPRGSRSVVDYERAYAVAVAEMRESPHLLAALKLQYDRRVALIGAGGVQ